MDIAADSVGFSDEMDHLGQAIEMLSPENQTFASDRFEEGMTLRSLSEEHGMSIKRTSQKARSLAGQLAELLGIQLPAPREASGPE